MDEEGFDWDAEAEMEAIAEGMDAEYAAAKADPDSWLNKPWLNRPCAVTGEAEDRDGLLVYADADVYVFTSGRTRELLDLLRAAGYAIIE